MKRFYMLPMRDGTRLATDIHLPDKGGPFPVVLMRSTYGREFDNPSSWTERGYGLVIQDVRGLGQSEGVFRAFAPDGWDPEQSDGADTVRWITGRPWCSGRIGTYGGSALGITQVRLAGATDVPEGQCIRVAASSFYGNLSYQGGVWRKELCEGWLALFGEDGEHTKELWKSHPSRDAFWDAYDIDGRACSDKTPAVHFGGWWDIFSQGTIHHYQHRSRTGERARNRQILIMKNCTHADGPVEDYQFRENQNDIRVSEIEHACFERWLKGDTSACLPENDVYYYVIGDDTDPNAPGNCWRSCDTWPPTGTEETTFFLSVGGALHTETEEAEEGSLTFASDPADPVPTLGGQNLVIASGPYDQRRVLAGEMGFTRDYERFGIPEAWKGRQQSPPVPRGDILSFRTEPLMQPLEIAGQVRVTLYVSTTAADTDFTAKLVDIYPAGDERAILLLDGIMRLKYRNGSGSAAGAEDIMQIDIDLWHTSCVFNTGHRIGLYIAGSNYPRFEINPNNGDDFPSKNPAMRANNTVHMRCGNRSALILPVMKRRGDDSKHLPF